MKKLIGILIVILTFTVNIHAQKSELVVYMKKGKYGFVNEKGKVVIKNIYNYAEPFSEGYAVVELDLKYGYIDENGDVKIPLENYDAGKFSEFAMVRMINPDTNVYGDSFTICGIIDKNDELLGGKWFSSIERIEVDSFRVYVKDVEYTLDRTGQLTLIGNKVKYVVEEMPEFIGGEMALLEFIKKNIRYPVSARKNAVQGKTYISFVVSETGTIEEITVAKSASPVLDKEAMRV
ncbi:MAG: TonB family protein, partial [Bacteroidia bacterium]|nr:TonB family protein [Bacteroidia bacterium]